MVVKMNLLPRCGSGLHEWKFKSCICNVSASQFVTYTGHNLKYYLDMGYGEHQKAWRSALKTQVNIGPFQTYWKRWFFKAFSSDQEREVFVWIWGEALSIPGSYRANCGPHCLLPWDPLCANCLELCGNIFLLPPFSSLTLLKICVRTKCGCIIAN